MATDLKTIHAYIVTLKLYNTLKLCEFSKKPKYPPIKNTSLPGDMYTAIQKHLKESLETEQVAFKLNTRSIARLNPQTLLQCLTSESERRSLVENMFGHGVNSMVWLSMRSGQRKSNYPIFFNKKRLGIIFGLPSCEFCRISKNT